MLKDIKFSLGRIVATPGAIKKAQSRLVDCLRQHSTCDWGVVCDEDKESNDRALKEGGRILSAYPIDPAQPCDGTGNNTLWIITESDRSVTTFLLPEEY